MTQQRRISFLVVCILGFYVESNGQKDSLKGEIFSTLLNTKEVPVPFVPKFSFPKRLRPSYGNPDVPGYQLLNLPAASYYPNSLGIVCKTELKLDKITPLPLRFRLGSLEYVNWLEQKPNSRRF